MTERFLHKVGMTLGRTEKLYKIYFSITTIATAVSFTWDMER